MPFEVFKYVDNTPSKMNVKEYNDRNREVLGLLELSKYINVVSESHRWEFRSNLGRLHVYLFPYGNKKGAFFRIRARIDQISDDGIEKQMFSVQISRNSISGQTKTVEEAIELKYLNTYTVQRWFNKLDPELDINA